MSLTRLFSVFFAYISISCTCIRCEEANYLVGTGLGDVTGPAAEINMMGYAMANQLSNGIHIRQFSRAFVIVDPNTNSRVAFVNVDACMISSLVKMQVVDQLSKYNGGIYNDSNICLSGIHTHSGPAGFHQYVLFDVTSKGFVKQSLEALVTGIVQSIIAAHESLRPGNLHVASGTLLDASINRSPTAYENNPAEEKAKYDANVDTTMTVVKMTSAAGEDIGMISWFPVHCTSMNNTNGLISGDNKGLASQLMERDMNPGILPQRVNFIAAFAQANEGDVSPNTMGPHCLDTGLPCDVEHSTCNGRTEKCVAAGPGKDMFDSTFIIGQKQYAKAKELYATANVTGLKLSGPVDFRHQYVDMSNTKFPLANGTQVVTCPAAMGYSFAAGTTDGPGEFNFIQGTNTSNPFWNFVSNFLSKPTPEQVACHSPKPILLNTGEINFPYQWQPAIVPTQLLRIGQMIIAALPAEFTTMAGRRMKDSLTKVLSDKGLDQTTVVLAGLSNDYADYVTTFEEYQVQRYEGGSTIYGPHTLEAYIYKFTNLAAAMAQGLPVDAGPSPPNLFSKQISFVLPVIFDSVPSGAAFGQPIIDANEAYKPGDQVRIVFNSADPRNCLMLMGSFLTVDQQISNGTWVTKFTDSHWETKFKWNRTDTMLGRSTAEVTWDIPANQESGTYRISHSGCYKPLFKDPMLFSGFTKTFEVVNQRRSISQESI